SAVWVKHFQAIHQLQCDVAHGLALLFGLGTKALPSWDSKTRWNNLLGDLAVNVTAGSSGHANSPHPSSREGHHSTVGWISGFLLSDLIRPVLRLRRPPWSTGTRCHQPRCGAWPTAAPAPRSPSSFRDTWRSSSPKP